MYDRLTLPSELSSLTTHAEDLIMLAALFARFAVLHSAFIQ